MDEDWYISLKDAVESAGLFVGNRMKERGWERAIVSSRQLPPLPTGNSFWITRINSAWYFGTWGPSYYRYQSDRPVIEFICEWFARYPRETKSHFDPDVQATFAMNQISEEEFDRLIGS